MPRRKTPKTGIKDRASRVTIIDVAKRAGVHWSTVSRALNPDKRHLISPEMIERVAACVQELGYRANALASGLRTQRSRTIGVIVSNLGDPVHPPIAEQQASPSIGMDRLSATDMMQSARWDSERSYASDTIRSRMLHAGNGVGRIGV